MQQKNTHDHGAALIFIRGLPGSGKSFLAAELVRRLGAKRAVLLDPDAVDMTSAAYKDHVQQQISEGVEPKLHLYRFLRARAFNAIAAGRIVIWNQPFRDAEVFNNVVRRFKDFAKENSVELQLLIIEVEIDAELARQRVQQRKESGGHGPSGDMFDRFVREHTSFEGKGYKIVRVQGNDPVEVSANKVLSSIEGLSAMV